MPNRSRDWCRQAERDMGHARRSGGMGDHEWACFAAQQAAEKALKALLQDRGGEVRGHSALALLRLLPTENGNVVLSLARERWSQGATVLDGDVVSVALVPEGGDSLEQAFRQLLALARQPRTHLHALYQGWMGALLALLAARVTGAFSAGKERQVARQVELNLEVKRVERQRSSARQKL
ncbi:hypothetical protein BH23GEM3_BH23GEM3_05700 [soil metagenome]